MADRDERGLFIAGNQVSKGHGRKRRATEEEYLLALNASVSIANWKKIVLKAVDQALEGDDRARTWLANYLIGKPTDYVNADLTSDGQAIQVLVRYADNQPDDPEAA